MTRNLRAEFIELQARRAAENNQLSRAEKLLAKAEDERRKK
jgi:hypothetical protein